MLDGAVPWPAELAERYRRKGYWRGETLAALLREPARTDGGRIAAVTRTGQARYDELDQRADRLAAGMHGLGLSRGDRIVVQLPNTFDFLLACTAAFRLGVVPVLALPGHRRAEITYLCQHTEAAALVVPDRYGQFDHRELAGQVREAAPALAHVLVAGDPGEHQSLSNVDAEPVDLQPPDPEDVALCLLSGGTTGAPKIIPRTHNDYLYQMRETSRAMGLGQPGVYLAALPAAHNAALGCPGVLGALWVGARVVLAAVPAPDEIFPLIEREGVTLTTAVPSVLSMWADTADLFDVDLTRLAVEVGGADLSPESARAAEHALGCTVTRWFGMAEGLLSFTRIDDPPEVRLTTEGRPLCPDDEVRVVDEHGRDVPTGEVGELLTRGPYTLRGYYRAPEYNRRAFTGDGFLRTGDLVRWTPYGHLVVAGRIKDVINRGGEKVAVEEVETCLRAHAKVKEVAVTALPDPALGERTCAFVVPTGEPPSLHELRAHVVGSGLAGYKQPDQLELVDVLPLTPVGKVDKSPLRERVTVRGG